MTRVKGHAPLIYCAPLDKAIFSLSPSCLGTHIHSYEYNDHNNLNGESARIHGAQPFVISERERERRLKEKKREARERESKNSQQVISNNKELWCQSKRLTNKSKRERERVSEGETERE